MIKKKLTAMIAVLLVCVMLFPMTAFAYVPDGEGATTEAPAVQEADTTETGDDIEPEDTTDEQE